MQKELGISEMGMRLIRAYEVDEDVNDISSIITLVNERVHAAMNQSQFDALCSLAYSIGEDAFINSQVRHAFNQGHIIEAANAFDTWRLSDVDGQRYVVDALVRRRTAEKALFLRPTHRTVPTLKTHLSPLQDADLKTSNENFKQVYNEKEKTAISHDEAIRISEPLELTQDIKIVEEMETKSSPIADAAAEVSQRLDALIENDMDNILLDDLPDSLIETQNDHDVEKNNVMPFKSKDDWLELDQPIEASDDGNYGVDIKFDNPNEASGSIWAYLTLSIIGLTTAALGLWANLTNSLPILGKNSSFITLAAIMIGTLLLVVGLYYLLKNLFSRA